MYIPFKEEIRSFVISAFQGRDLKDKLLRIGSLVLVSGLFFLFLITLLVRIGIFGPIPSPSQIKSIKNPVSSVLFDDENRLLGKYFIENRTNVNYSAISPHLIEALIATEDRRFYEHHGIDLRSWGRVLFKTVLMSDESSGGGSTISQQLAKNLYPRKNYWLLGTPINKIREMLLAKRLERIYNKEEILTWYLNTVPFGNGIFGIEVACKQLFNTNTESISVQNAAVLIGMLKATGVYSPLRNEDRSLDRRNTVLRQMAKNNFITTADYDSLSHLPIKLNYKKEGHTDGIATYIREQIRLDLNKILRDKLNEDGKPYNLYTDGLKIYTTLDVYLQRLAEDAVRERMTRLQADFDLHWKKREPWDHPSFLSDQVPKTDRYSRMKRSGASEAEIEQAFKNKVPMSIFTYKGQKDTLLSPMDSLKYYLKLLNAGFLALDYKTGKVKAWVGGIDYASFKYDHVRSRRQVGSTFKPIVMAAALTQDYTPCDYFANDHVIYAEYDGWEPHNNDGKYGGFYSMEGTLVHSVNCAAVDAIIQVGTKPVIELARKLGIQSDLPSVPSLALGSADISLLEMVQAFGVFANNGNKAETYYIKRIENSKGELIVDFEMEKKIPEEIMTPTQAQLMVQMLKSVAESGTARGLKTMYSIGSEIGGKTGTTQNQTDGWLIAITPNLSIGAWVGGEWPQIRFRSMNLGQGSYTALPICGSFLHKLNASKSVKKFQGGSFPPLTDEAMTMLGCPYFIENEGEDLERLALGEFGFGDTTFIAMQVDTVRDISRRKRARERENRGIGGFFERLFKKKEKADTTAH
ncbi:MAG: transglycosylase domain-containing protein [Saprospiraceae bacterium]|nr:transglycosylase domain-containing protein [Saprospiraceae bacterium]